jgi:hypothetical protein
MKFKTLQLCFQMNKLSNLSLPIQQQQRQQKQQQQQQQQQRNEHSSVSRSERYSDQRFTVFGEKFPLFHKTWKKHEEEEKRKKNIFLMKKKHLRNVIQINNKKKMVNFFP